MTVAIVRRRLPRCPVCHDQSDGRVYRPDPEQERWGYPARYRICRSCATPLLEIGDSHCREFPLASVGGRENIESIAVEQNQAGVWEWVVHLREAVA